MSCADDDDVDCAEALDQIYEYLYGELDPSQVAAMKAHIERCSHCLEEYGVEQEIHALVARSCSCRPAPEELRRRIVETITHLRVTASFGPNTASATISVRSKQQPWQ
jgi:mycothiol system anti-sigma-R factor